jgi:hypothetical protein
VIEILIIEGPDGAGKTNLVKRLSTDLRIPIHERSANSDSSATLNTEVSRGANLAAWAYKDVITMPDQPFSIYDRHCLISEFVYGPITRGHLDPNMLSTTVHFLIRTMAEKCFVVFCHPTNEEITKNIQLDPVSQSVVGTNGLNIAYAYDALKMFWPGQNMYYNYEDDCGGGAYESVLTAARLHMVNWERKYKDV